LKALAAAGFVTLDPPPPPPPVEGEPVDAAVKEYRALLAYPTAKLDHMLVFRSVHPLYAVYLLEHLGIGDRNERLQALESMLEVPKPVLKYVRVPRPDEMPPGPLAARLDPDLIQRGLIAAPLPEPQDDEEDDGWEREEDRPPTLAEKLRLLFEAKYPDVADAHTQSVWAAGELFRHGNNFNLYVKVRDLTKQEGIVFRHLLRLILLCGEFAQVCPVDTTPEAWQADMRDLANQLTESCRAIDPASTDEMMEKAREGDVVEGEGV
jgi:hypothetical protein